jgi:hypothetical protein
MRMGRRPASLGLPCRRFRSRPVKERVQAPTSASPRSDEARRSRRSRTAGPQSRARHPETPPPPHPSAIAQKTADPRSKRGVRTDSVSAWGFPRATDSPTAKGSDSDSAKAIPKGSARDSGLGRVMGRASSAGHRAWRSQPAPPDRPARTPRSPGSALQLSEPSSSLTHAFWSEPRHESYPDGKHPISCHANDGAPSDRIKLRTATRSRTRAISSVCPYEGSAHRITGLVDRTTSLDARPHPVTMRSWIRARGTVAV